MGVGGGGGVISSCLSGELRPNVKRTQQKERLENDTSNQ